MGGEGSEERSNPGCGKSSSDGESEGAGQLGRGAREGKGGEGGGKIVDTRGRRERKWEGEGLARGR